MKSQNKQDVIITQHVMLGYGKNTIVDDITLNIHSGEFIGIFGPNGAGKSTFLRALLGLIKPLAGNMHVLGATPRQGNEKIGYMPQIRSYHSMAHLTSRSILVATLNGTRFGLPILSQTQKEEIQKILETVGAASYADRPFYQLSGGERQRVFLAQALLGNPAILLLDEPLASLDPRYQENFITLLQHIQQKLNVTILFSAHDPNPLLSVMTRVLYFAKKKAVIGTVDSIITSNVLSSLYGMPIEVIRLKDRLFVLGEHHIHAQESAHHG